MSVIGDSIRSILRHFLQDDLRAIVLEEFREYHDYLGRRHAYERLHVGFKRNTIMHLSEIEAELSRIQPTDPQLCDDIRFVVENRVNIAGNVPPPANPISADDWKQRRHIVVATLESRLRENRWGITSEFP